MKRLRHFIRNLTGFSAREADGFMALALLMAGSLAAPSLYRCFFSPVLPDTSTADSRTLDSLLTEINQALKSNPDSEATTLSPRTKLFAFDPNTATLADMQLLGFPAKLAARINNYRSKGGKFRRKTDLLKIYFFPHDLFSRLQPYIALPDSLPKRFTPDSLHRKRFRVFAAPAPFNLNTTDTNALIALKNIGPYLANRIIAYREKLGGFTSLNQLHEVWPLDSLEIAETEKYARLPDPVPYRRLNVNTLTEHDLALHPYMPRRMAKLIVAYRVQHGPYQSTEQLLQIKAWKTADFERLKPYLSTGD